MPRTITSGGSSVDLPEKWLDRYADVLGPLRNASGVFAFRCRRLELLVFVEQIFVRLKCLCVSCSFYVYWPQRFG